MGAMEVFVNGCLIYSKLKGGRWPNKGEVKKKFLKYVQGKSLVSYDKKVKKSKKFTAADLEKE